jgi:hypothetical protein
MPKLWKRVGIDADVMEHGGVPIIRITRGTKGDAMAAVEHLHWFEPDGHEYTGYADVVIEGRRPASDVLREYRKTSTAMIAIEDESLWDCAWGDLAK